MLLSIKICDICGDRIDSKDDKEPDGKGGIIDIRDDNPISAEFHYRDYTKSMDFCVNCAKKIQFYMISSKEESRNKN